MLATGLRTSEAHDAWEIPYKGIERDLIDEPVTINGFPYESHIRE